MKATQYPTSIMIPSHYGLGWDLNRISIVASIQGEGLFFISGIPGSPLGMVEVNNSRSYFIGNN